MYHLVPILIGLSPGCIVPPPPILDLLASTEYFVYLYIKYNFHFDFLYRHRPLRFSDYESMIFLSSDKTTPPRLKNDSWRQSTILLYNLYVSIPFSQFFQVIRPHPEKATEKKTYKNFARSRSRSELIIDST